MPTGAKASGVRLADRESVQVMLGDLAMQIEIGRLLVMKAAWEIDRGGYAQKEVSMAKIHVANLLHKAVDVAIQINGARGYSKDTVLEWIYRYARQARLVDGADEVHKMILNRHLQKGGTCLLSLGDGSVIDAQVDGAIDFEAAQLGRFLAATLGPDQGMFHLTRIGRRSVEPVLFPRLCRPGAWFSGSSPQARSFGVLTRSTANIACSKRLPRPGVPVPRPVLYHERTPETLGTPFYLMERVDGRIFTDTSLRNIDPAGRRAIWMAVADAMSAMHAVRPDDVGLGDYGRTRLLFRAPDRPLEQAVSRLAFRSDRADRATLRLARGQQAGG